MEGLMGKWYGAAEKRFSVRKYSSVPSLEDLLALEEMAKQLSIRGVRIAIGVEEKVFSGILGSIIKGTSAFAAFISSNGDNVSIGYLGEAFILECAAMGLGTCWLGASYNHSVVKKCIGLKENEKVVAVTPIGISAEPFVRRKRKQAEEIAWLDEGEFEEIPKWQRGAIECVVAAPSALNAQPYEIVVEGDSLVVEKTSGNFTFGDVDRGIAMLHTEIGAAAHGVQGNWQKEGKAWRFVPESGQ